MFPVLIFIAILTGFLTVGVVIAKAINHNTSSPVVAAYYAALIAPALIEAALAGGFTPQTTIITWTFIVLCALSMIIVEIENFRKIIARSKEERANAMPIR